MAEETRPSGNKALSAESGQVASVGRIRLVEGTIMPIPTVPKSDPVGILLNQKAAGCG